MKRNILIGMMLLTAWSVQAQKGTQPDNATVIVGSQVLRTIDVLANDNLNTSNNYVLQSFINSSPLTMDIQIVGNKVTYKELQPSPTPATFYYVVKDLNTNRLDTETVIINKSDLLADQYPGDANKDQICNHIDVLNIGIAYGKANQAREGIFFTDNWTPIKAYNWTQNSLVSNYRFADVNGDGVVNDADLSVINKNYNQIVQTVSTTYSPTGGSTFSIVGGDSFVIAGNQNHYTMKVFLGTASQPVNGAYGMSFSLIYDPILFKSPNFTFNAANWFKDQAQTISFFKNNQTKGELECTIVRKNGLNSSGDSLVCSIDIIVDDVLGAISVLNTGLQVGKVVLIDSNYRLLPVNNSPSKPIVVHKSTSSIQNAQQDKPLHYFFNQDRLIMVNKSTIKMPFLRIYNILGEQLFETKDIKSNQEVNINTSSWSNGFYFIQSENKTYKVLKD